MGGKGYQPKYIKPDPEKVKALIKRVEEWKRAQEERKALKDKNLH